MKEEKETEVVVIPPEVPKDWDRCHAYVWKKRRFCRQMVCPPPPLKEDEWTNNNSNNNNNNKKKKKLYCGNHASLYYEPGHTNTNTNTNTSNIECIPCHHHHHRPNKRQRLRIPCPLDPSHTIYEDNLKKHLKICPKQTRQNNQQKQIYYRHNINKGGYPTTDTTDTTNSTNDSWSWKESLELAWNILYAYHLLFGKQPPPPPSNSSSSSWSKEYLASQSFKDMYECIPLEDGIEYERQLGYKESMLHEKRIKVGGPKHVHQIGSITHHIRPHISSSPILLELGAGRGMTGLMAASVTAATTATTTATNTNNNNNNSKVQLIMVERSGSRAKADTAIRRNNNNNNNSNSKSEEEKEYMNVERVEVTRIKCDLAHVHMPTVMQSNTNNDDEKKVWVVAKHLCGAGTDLALKSILPIRSILQGCTFATCCHGVCNWNDYVGKSFLSQLFSKNNNNATTTNNNNNFCLGPREFEIMRRWSCASVRTTTPSSSSTTNNNNNSPPSTTTTTINATNATNTDDNDHPSQDVIEEEEDGNDNNNNDNNSNICKVVKELKLQCGIQGLGRACQRLIDYGRCQYMKHHLFLPTSSTTTTTTPIVTMCHYVDTSVTPQNALLKAHLP